MIIKYLVRLLGNDKLNYLRDKEDNIMLFDSFEQAFVNTKEGIKGFVERIDIDEQYVLKDETNDKYIKELHYVMNMYDILQEINRDRSAEWTDYDQLDFKEGLEEWTNLKLIGKLERI